MYAFKETQKEGEAENEEHSLVIQSRGIITVIL